MDIVNILKIVNDENRMRILNIIKEDALCVGEIQTLLGITQTNASKHLEKIRSSGIADCEKRTQFSYYKISDEALKEYKFLKELLFEDIKGIELFDQDLIKLKKYKESKLCCKDLKAAGFRFEILDI